MTTSPLPADHFLARATARLAPLLERLGYRAKRQEYSHESFGSALTEYRGRKGQLRLIWDGKEGALLADHRRWAWQEWTDVESAASGQPPRFDTAVDESRLERLAAAIEHVAAR